MNRLVCSLPRAMVVADKILYESSRKFYAHTGFALGFFFFPTTFANLIFFLCAYFFKFGPFIATLSQVILI